MENFEEYLKDRWEDQKSWYGNKSKSAKKWHLRFQIAIIVATVLVTLLTALGIKEIDVTSIVTSIVASLVVVLVSISQLMKFEENWIRYRTTAEALKKEKVFFDTLTGPYSNSENPEQDFVERIESLISVEHQTWFQEIKKK